MEDVLKQKEKWKTTYYLIHHPLSYANKPGVQHGYQQRQLKSKSDSWQNDGQLLISWPEAAAKVKNLPAVPSAIDGAVGLGSAEDQARPPKSRLYCTKLPQRQRT